MCQRNTVTEKPPAEITVGAIAQLSEAERRQEIDYRVMAKLAERDYVRQEYRRGFWDCLYICLIVAWAVYLFYFNGTE